jgi:hypothetical protein
MIDQENGFLWALSLCHSMNSGHLFFSESDSTPFLAFRHRERFLPAGLKMLCFTVVRGTHNLSACVVKIVRRKQHAVHVSLL